MRSFLKWLIGGACVLAVVGALLSLGDERLRPEAAALIEDAHPPPPPAENGYYALLAGIDVALGEDPAEVGRALAEAYESALARYRGTEPFELEPYPQERRIPIADAVRSLCAVEQAPCLRSYAKQAEAISRLIAEHEMLLGRYQDLYRYQDFVTAATQSPYSPLPSFTALLSIHRLLQASIATRFMSGDEQRAVEELARDLRFQRQLMASADNLLLKMVALTFFGRDLHLYAQMLDAKGFDPSRYDSLMAALGPINDSERSLRKPLESEFRAGAHMLLEGLPAMDLFRAGPLAGDAPPSEGGSSSSSFASRIVSAVAYKPNLTVNRSFDQLLGADVDLGALPAASFAQRWGKDGSGDERPEGIEDVIGQFFSWPFNPVGNILIAIAAPEYGHYLARIHDSDGLLRLVELKRLLRAQDIEAGQVDGFLHEHQAELTNPYTGEAMRYDGSREVIFFDGLSVRDESDRWRAEVPLYLVLTRF